MQTINIDLAVPQGWHEFSGALYRSTLAVGMTANGKVTSVTLSQRFNTYGIFQDYGTGREVLRGNTGDIRHGKVRQCRKWFSTKYYAFVMNLKGLFADNLGLDFTGIVANSFNYRSFRQSLIR